ncbi:MAG: MBL fold metallo-hydrolase [Desulfatibacillaceae bacterium]|nr:MBL fold metallo-hydrolase [Desulfatibacillaceae bacterium]
MLIRQILPELFLIRLDQPTLSGFSNFIGSWLYKGKSTLLVDCGPASTTTVLIEAIKSLGVKRPDALLLTHIHLDHAGGAGDFVKKMGKMPVVCHEKGIPHLAEPSRLWDGSVKTLKETALAYGPMTPLDTALLKDAASFAEFGVEAIPTPGHAPHHVSYKVGDILFAGEAAGVCLTLPDDGFYLRPATPPRFFMETSLKSLEKILNTPHKMLCYGHFGATLDGKKRAGAHKEQLKAWLETIRRTKDLGRKTGEDLLQGCLDRLLESDPFLAAFANLPMAVRAREKFFLENSIRGFLEYLESRA